MKSVSYKLSFYNLVVPLERRQVLWYNSLSGSLLALSRQEYEEALGFVQHRESPPRHFQVFLRGGFLVPSARDETKEYLSALADPSQEDDHLSLTIAITNRCNLACRFCYVRDSQPCVMGHREGTQLVKAIEHFAKVNPCRAVFVTWTGGEPLLAMDELQSTSRLLKDFCASRGMYYRANMITNGTLLDPDTVRELGKANVSSFQVSLEPSASLETHARPLRCQRKGLFDEVYRNISTAADHTAIVIRIALCRRNRRSVVPFVRRLSRDGLLDKGVRFSLGHLHPMDHHPASVLTDVLDDSEFAKTYFAIYDRLWREGTIGAVPFPTREAGCWAHRENVFVVDANGRIYKCFEDVFDHSKAIGSLFSRYPFANRLQRWNAWRTFSTAIESGPCSECRLLPVCNGGCPKIRLFYLRSRLGAFCECRCNQWALGYAKGLTLYYEAWKKRRYLSTSKVAAGSQVRDHRVTH